MECEEQYKLHISGLETELKDMRTKNAVLKINKDVAEDELKDVRSRSEMMENDIKQCERQKEIWKLKLQNKVKLHL